MMHGRARVSCATATSDCCGWRPGASTLGDRIVFVALALYVTDIGSPTDVGIVLAAHALPLVGFLLIGGVWADRLPRHRVMVATDLVRVALHALLAVLIFTGTGAIWAIVVIEAAFGTAEAFFRPAYTGLIPQTVPEDEHAAGQRGDVAGRRPRPSSPARRWRPRSCSGSAPAGRSRSTRRRSSSRPLPAAACARGRGASGSCAPSRCWPSCASGWREVRSRHVDRGW